MNKTFLLILAFAFYYLKIGKKKKKVVVNKNTTSETYDHVKDEVIEVVPDPIDETILETIEIDEELYERENDSEIVHRPFTEIQGLGNDLKIVGVKPFKTGGLKTPPKKGGKKPVNDVIWHELPKDLTPVKGGLTGSKKNYIEQPLLNDDYEFLLS
jgi:hypothetical protein